MPEARPNHPLVVVPDPLSRLRPYPELRDAVERSGGRFVVLDSPDALADYSDAATLVIHWLNVDGALLQSLPNCRLVVRYGVGYDNVDLKAASERGVTVCNTPSYCIDEVADHTLALLLAFARKVLPLADGVRNGGWRAGERSFPPPTSLQRLRGKTLGLVGFGNIGRAVAARVLVFGLRVLVHDPKVNAGEAKGLGMEKTDLELLLRTSDYVSLHVPLIPATHHLMNAERLGLMKPSAYLLNASRGPVVDEGALIDALQQGKLAGAALDVLEQEPPAPDNPLLTMENVIITPHYGAASDVSIEDQHREVIASVTAFLAGQTPPYAVNQPSNQPTPTR